MVLVFIIKKEGLYAAQFRKRFKKMVKKKD